MIERALLGVPGLLALAAGAALAGGLPAAAVGLAATPILAATTLRPRWADGPTLVAAALIIQVAAADERAWWRTMISALLLAVVLTTGEIAQTGARHTAWGAALAVHVWPGRSSLIGIATLTGAATAVVHDATAAAILTGLAAGAALATLQLTRKLSRD
jgi:hypothetical protein